MRHDLCYINQGDFFDHEILDHEVQSTLNDDFFQRGIR